MPDYFLLTNGDNLLLVNGVDALLLAASGPFVPGDPDPTPLSASYRETTTGGFRESTSATSREA